MPSHQVPHPQAVPHPPQRIQPRLRQIIERLHLQEEGTAAMEASAAMLAATDSRVGLAATVREAGGVRFSKWV
jgi:hypothetical protein